jgi:hypothetical protein
VLLRFVELHQVLEHAAPVGVASAQSAHAICL